MGIVALAAQRSLRREVAVKRVRPGVDVERARGTLIREGMIMGSLEHPNIVPVHALGSTLDGEALLVMKRVEGSSWKEELERRPQPEQEWLTRQLQTLMAVCNGVEFAHRHGVIHRDIKPANVMLGGYGETYLLDWGIAVRSDQVPELAAEGFAGTPAYAAPEMMEDARDVTERTDVYLLGACLHEVLTGSPRNGGDNMLQVMMRCLTAEPFEYAEEVPSELAQIANRACATSPEDRYASAAELRNALAEHLQHRGSLTLSEAASGRLRELQQLIDAAPASRSSVVDQERLAVSKLFGEGRFGFQQALRAWPDNVDAQRGLQRLLELMTDFELRQGNAPAAAALLFEMQRPAPELRARLEALQAELELDDAKRERLLRLERELDPRVSQRPRNLTLMALFVVALAIGGTLAPLYVMGVRSIDTKLGTLIAAAVTVCLLGGAWLKRGVYLRNRANRQIAGLVLAVAVTVTTNRVAGVLAGRDMPEVLSLDALIAGFGFAMGGIFFRKLLIVPAVLMAAAGVMAPQLGRSAPLAVAGMAVFCVAFSLVGTGAWKQLRR